MTVIRKFFSLIWSHKLKYFVSTLAFFIFVLLLFPYDEVGDFAGVQIAKATQNQIFVQFEKLKLGLFPDAMVGAEKLSFATPQINEIRADSVEVRPSLTALLMQKPEGQLVATGLFRGDVLVDLKPGKKTEAGTLTHHVSLKAEKLNLSEIHKVAELPLLLKGRINLTTSGTADPSFQEQPDFDIDLSVDNFELPAGSVETMMGPLNVPDLKLTTLQLKGRLSAGRFLVEKGVIGKPGDEIFGSASGNISILIQNKGQIQPVIGAYQFDIDLDAKKSFQDKAALFLSFLDAYKTPTAGGAKFKFKLNATSPQMPPSISALR